MNEPDSESSSTDEEPLDETGAAHSRGDNWFYSHEGERIGPVSFAELQDKAKAGGLNPRLDLVWKHGMENWQASGEIKDLFERRAEPEHKECFSPASTEPYTPPEQESAEDIMSRQEDWPGARRRSYLFTLLIFPFLWNFAIALSTVMMREWFGPQILEWIIQGAMFVPVIVVITVTVNRFKNLGMSGWWWLGMMMPFLNIWLGYRCFACPSGYAFHKKLDGVGIFLAIIYWLLIVVGVLAIAAVVAILSGAYVNPELQHKLQEIFQPPAHPKA